MIWSCPKDAVGHVSVPDGCTDAEVFDCPGATSIAFPDGCTRAIVVGNPGVTSIAFPDGCARAWVTHCPAYQSLYNDPRGFQLVYVGGMYHAGCWSFSYDEAIAHWSSPEYEDPKRGAEYVAAIKKHQEAL